MKPKKRKITNVEREAYNEGDIVQLWGEPYKLQQPIPSLNEWYREQLKLKISQRLPRLEDVAGNHCSEWRVKNMKTRWGSCNYNAKRIWLNLQLARYPQSCLEYVIMHELVHLKIPNHSALFYAELDRCMPDWRERKMRLEQAYKQNKF